jgi:lethal(2) giant larvae protein
MLKFIRGRGHHGHLSQDKIKELFAFQTTVPHGFPHHPTALAYDAELSLIAVTSKRGILRVYGRPGVEYSVDLPEVESDIKEIHFLPGKRGQLILLTADGLIQLWEIKSQLRTLVKVKTWDDFVRGEGSIRHATTVAIVVSQPSTAVREEGSETVTSGHQELLVGTESGNIYAIDLESLEQTADNAIHQDVVLQSIPSEYKKSSQGSVEVIAQRPGSDNSNPEILVGFTRGIIVVWNIRNRKTTHFFSSSQVRTSFSL